jgi:hypothetical protein
MPTKASSTTDSGSAGGPPFDLTVCQIRLAEIYRHRWIGARKSPAATNGWRATLFSRRRGSADSGRVRVVRCSWRSAVAGIGAPANPLRRRCDRLETAAAVGAGCLVVLALPFAMLAGVDAGGAVSAVAAAHANSRTAATATVLAYPGGEPRRELAPPNRRVAELGWTGPDGRTQSRTASVPAYLQRGSTTTVWVDKDGRLVGEPMAPAIAYGAAIGAVLAVEAGALASAVLAFTGTQLALHRGRNRLWDDALLALLKDPAEPKT